MNSVTPDGLRRCPSCGERKPLDAYRKSPTTSDGRVGSCFDCQLESDFLWSRVLNYWDFKCAACGVSDGGRHRTLERDHWFIPSSKGGVLTAMNLIPLCSSCNSSKGDGDGKSFLLRRFGDEIGEARNNAIEAYFAWVTNEDSPDNTEAIYRKCAAIKPRLRYSADMTSVARAIGICAMNTTDNPEQARAIVWRIMVDMFADATRYIDRMEF